MVKVLIAPSTDPIKTVEEIVNYVKLIQNKADFLHCDIMDGKFVENVTYSYDVLKVLNDNTLLPLDVHLMVDNPTNVIDKFIANGANILTVHYEAYKNKKLLIKDLKKIRKLGALSGVSIKPATQIDEIVELLSYCDLLLIMAVEPGRSGQSFIDDTYLKLAKLNKIKKEYELNLKIEIDGGINPSNAKRLKELGANILVSGSFIYESDDRSLAISTLK